MLVGVVRTEGRLPGCREQALPVLVLYLQAVTIATAHLIHGHHGHPVLEMTYHKVSVAAHQSLNAAQCYLTT